MLAFLYYPFVDSMYATTGRVGRLYLDGFIGPRPRRFVVDQLNRSGSCSALFGGLVFGRNTFFENESDAEGVLERAATISRLCERRRRR